ncbi:hypothetical protein FRB95_007270 [Tulasnella sp. JGI-2019a]|nr:hypothetical protein FRB93_011138 [Tulasnella sp. JGI-2019a]KAG9036976.1 hypothetical protein FRB95_007270 [Tulasnella sp. JGI-2019a]
MPPMTTRTLLAIDTSGAGNASSVSQRSAGDQPPLTATFETATAAYYDRSDGLRSEHPSAYPYDAMNETRRRPAHSHHDRRSTEINLNHHEERLSYTTAEGSSSGGGLPYDEPDYHEPRANRSSRPVPNPGPPALVYDPDYVIAMHDFVPDPANATCLSFSAGEVIHVCNRDATGWWDGELDGRRGWFPSNYVSTDAAAFAAAAELAGFAVAHIANTPTQGSEHLAVTQDQPESSKAGSRSPPKKSRSRRSLTRSRKPTPGLDLSDTSESILDRRASCPPLMIPMVHALALLQTAVRANRVTHFQPSTACIISCVRSVLSTCDCLNKDSPHLTQHPSLTQQRKKVLAELARLVGQARQASESPQSKLAAIDPDAKRAQLLDPERQKELSEMVRLGDLVYQQVKKFLTLAVNCGIELPQDRVFADAPGMGDLVHAQTNGGYNVPIAENRNVAGPSRVVVQPSASTAAAAVGTHRAHGRRSSSMSDLHNEPAAEAARSTKPGPSRELNDGYVDIQSPTSPTSSHGSSTPSVTSAEDGQSGAGADWVPRAREESSSTYRPRKPGELRRQKSLLGDRPSARSSVEFHPLVANNHSTPPSLLSQKRQSWGSRGLTVPSAYQRASPARQAAAPYRKPKYSISSVSSLSSYESSQLDSGSPPMDSPAVFPSGLTTTNQALATLRITHDRLLSVIAAFIGHIHSHSRSSHASSKGHLIEMTRKTVDQVRFLLTLVDAVEEHEGICDAKPREMAMLKNARVALYNSTNDIVEGVKDMMSPPEGGVVSEEEEKARALQAATGTLRAGGDCVKSVNMCLTKIGGKPFLINIAAVPGADADLTAEPSTTPPSATSTSVSVSPPGTPKLPGTFRRTHAHSISHPHPQGPRISKHSHSSSTGGSLLRTRRPQSDISPIRGEGPARRRAEMAEGVAESLNEETLEENEKTVILGMAAEPLSNMAISGHGEDSAAETDDGESSVVVRAPSATPTLPSLMVSDDSFPMSEQPSSSSDGTAVSQLSMHNNDQVSARTSMDMNSIDISRSSANTPDVDSVSATLAENQGCDEAGNETDAATIGDVQDAGTMSQVPSAVSALEDKLIHGDLPATPSAPPEFVDAVYDPRDLLTNDSQQLVAASLEVMTIKIAPLSFTPDRAFVVAFLLTFRLFTTPVQLAEALINRWNTGPPATWPEAERREWQAKIPFMRIRVARCLKTWIDHFWLYETDDAVLPHLQRLVDQPLPDDADISLSNIVVVVRSLVYSELARARRNDERPMDRVKMAVGHLLPAGMPSPGEMPTPLFKRSVNSRLGAMDLDTPVTELEALEVARQLTLMEAKLYCDIPAQELVELGKQGAKSFNVKAISTFSTAITGWVSESILNEPDGKKRSGLLKYFIKLAERCVGLHNYSTMRSVLAALDSSTISRLTKTWTHLSTKYKVQLDAMRTLTDHAKNYAIYRETLRATQPPAVPFLGLYLTDLTFCREGNPNTRPSPLDSSRSLINFIKYYRLARIVQDVQRFQSMPYNLQPVPEIQRYLTHVIEKGKSTGDLQDLYRRSLVLEPRQASDAVPPDSRSGLLGWATRN